ncbi:MAG TPA: phosphonoacetaldehyde hydrolase [Blastocatellia bacterium]
MSTDRPYRGKLRAVIFDWAGTIIDHGSLAPVRALEELFRAHEVPITEAEARMDMGLLKKDHIRSILSGSRVSAAWSDKYGGPPSETDVEELFADFIPRQLHCLAGYSELIPGLVEVTAAIRKRGMKVGGTTGYTRPMLDLLLERAAAQGFIPDCALCPEDVGAGRPNPWMCYETAVRLRVYPLESFVKVGDTLSDIEEGLNAGMWTIGVARTGNLIGLSESDLARLPSEDRQARVEAARGTFSAAGAHYIVEAVADLSPILDSIDERLSKGDRP